MDDQSSGALQGGASGAATGASVGGGYGAVIGGVLGAGAGYLSSKKRKIKTPDQGAITATANAGADKEIQVAKGLTEALQPLNKKYGQDAFANSAGLKTKVAAMGNAYKAEQARLGTEQSTNLSNTLRQNVISAQPDIQRSLRESLAASGGLSRGAAPAAFGRAGEAAANQIGQGESAIQTQRLQGLQDASQKVFGANLQAVMAATGMDADTLQTLLNSGRQDLINEAQAIVNAERSRTGNILGIQQNANTYNLASQTASAAGQNSLIQALLAASGQALGSYYGSKAPAATPAKV